MRTRRACMASVCANRPVPVDGRPSRLALMNVVHLTCLQNPEQFVLQLSTAVFGAWCASAHRLWTTSNTVSTRHQASGSVAGLPAFIQHIRFRGGNGPVHCYQFTTAVLTVCLTKFRYAMGFQRVFASVAANFNHSCAGSIAAALVQVIR